MHPSTTGTTNLVQIDALVEVRDSSAVGTVTVSTNMYSPGCRYYYSQGEAINLTVTLRVNHTAANASGALPMPTTIPVQIVEESVDADGSFSHVVVFNGTVSIHDDNYGGAANLIVPGVSTRRFRPGRYLVTSPSAFLQDSKLSVAPQPIYVGRVYASPSFKINQYVWSLHQ